MFALNVGKAKEKAEEKQVLECWGGDGISKHKDGDGRTQRVRFRCLSGPCQGYAYAFHVPPFLFLSLVLVSPQLAP